jgi:hypothetical protein
MSLIISMIDGKMLPILFRPGSGSSLMTSYILYSGIEISELSDLHVESEGS